MKTQTFVADQKWKHIDVGCGDGGLIFHLSRIFSDRSNISWSGVDNDPNAISWARLMNGSRATFFAGNISDSACNLYDSATLIEVAEHIPPDMLPDFIKDIS